MSTLICLCCEGELPYCKVIWKLKGPPALSCQCYHTLVIPPVFSFYKLQIYFWFFTFQLIIKLCKVRFIKVKRFDYVSSKVKTWMFVLWRRTTILWGSLKIEVASCIQSFMASVRVVWHYIAAIAFIKVI